MLSSLVQKRWFRVGLALVHILLVASFVFTALNQYSQSKKPQPTNTGLSPLVINEVSFDLVLTSFMHRMDLAVDPESRILLVPHHLVAGREIASLLASSPVRGQAILLSPDHFTKGTHAFSTTRRSFDWQNKRITPSQALLDRLLNRLPQTLRIQDNVFEREHGVRGLLPFFQLAWQHTDVTPITVRADASDKAMIELAQVLHEELQTNPNLTIVVTIDFSHELPAYLADLHDAYAIQELQALHSEAAHSVEIDSPPLFVLLATLTKLQGGSLDLQGHTNSLRLMNAKIATLGTSHVLMSQNARATNSANVSSFTFFHDPHRPIASVEDRVYRGYTNVQTAQIPFPVVFVREETPSKTIWHAIPLKQTENTQWEVVSDQTFRDLKMARINWETWARTYLPVPSSE